MGFVFPAIAVLAVLLIYPLVYVIRLSFGNLQGANAYAFVGLKNYVQILHDPDVVRSFLNTFVFTAGSVVFHLILGLAVALLLNQKIRGRSFFRAVTIIPWTVSTVVTAIIWRWMLDPQLGIINAALESLGVIGKPIAWLSNLHLAMPALIFANGWRGFPFDTVMLLAGLQAIPSEQYEAAAVDGASPLARFWYVTLPNLRFIIAVTVILDAIFNVKLFDLIYVMTNGGPVGRTETAATWAYKVAFENYQFGYSSAIAMVLFLILLAFTIFYLRTLAD